jgi:uncharacterized protein YbjQ (UPF0145 family)
VSAELPGVAQARIAALQSSGTWGSTLAVDEFAAIRSVGFEPVGQVFGAAVYDAGAVGGYACPGASGPDGGGPDGAGPDGAGSDGGGSAAQLGTQVSGAGGAGSFGPLVQAMDLARQTAVGRMMTECGALGGHGVVGVRVSRDTFPFGAAQFTVIGTAVRASGATPGPPGQQKPTGQPGSAPFTSDVSGQDFAKLIKTGWVPVGLVAGLAIGARHDDRTTVRQARWSSGNAEVAGWSELVTQSRCDARRQLESDVRRLGAEGVVVAGMRLRVRQRDCPASVGRHDHIVEATLIGTAIARFARAKQPQDAPPVAIMSLDPQRRQAARIRI